MKPSLCTPRLALRPLSADDEALYCRLYRDPVVMQWIGAPQSAEVAERGFRTALRLENQTPAQRRFWVMHVVEAKEDIGLIGLVLDAPGAAEVGVVLPEACQGRGFATEAIAAIADHAFGPLGLRRLHTRHEADHGLAAGLMRRLGFEKTAGGAAGQPFRWELTAERWRARTGDNSRGNPLT